MTNASSLLTIRPRLLEDDPRLLEIFVQYEDVFPFSLEEWRFHFDGRIREENKQPVLKLGEVNGKIVGDWYVQPHYSGVDGVFATTVEVDESETGQGYGELLWLDAEAYMVSHDVTKAYVQLRSDLNKGQRFAARHGFTKTGRAERISRLMIADANLAGYEGAEETLLGEGIIIKTVSELDAEDEQFLRELHEAAEEMLSDIPRTEEEFEGTPFEIWRQNFLKSPGSRDDTYWIALFENHPVGLANLQMSSGGGAFNGLTGVVRAHRGKGVARALKLKTISWCRDNGVEFIDTGNDAANERMLSINIPLGYKALPARDEWVKEYSRPEK